MGLFGSDDSLGTQSPTPYGSLRIQTSTQGVVIPVIFGTQRIAGNLIWAGDFQATAVQSGGGGKGGGKGSVSSYDYSSSYMMALCEGPIASIGQVWNGKAVLDEPSSDMTIGLGLYPQMPWSYLLTKHPSQAIAYPGIAYCAIPNADLGSANSLPNTSFEILGFNILAGTQASSAIYTISDVSPYSVIVSPPTAFIADIGVTYQATGIALTKVSSNPAAGQYSIGTGTTAGIYYFNSADAGNDVIISCQLEMLDANPATIITEIITNQYFGIYSGFPLDVSDYSNWCLGANILLSCAFTSQQTLSQAIDTILEETFSTAILHDGKTLQFKSYGDTAMTANGVTWTPNLTPVCDLIDDDFITDNDQIPVTLKRKSSADSYNDVKVEYTDRANSYNVGIAEYFDQGNIDTYMRRIDNTRQHHDICQAGIAQMVVQLIGQKQLYVRNTFEFTVGWRFDYLECMDIVTLTDANLGLNQFPVRITQIEEDEKFNRKITAEEFPAGMGHALIATPTAHGGLVTNTNVDPLNVNTPYIFNAPGILTKSGYEVWAAVSGGPQWGGCDVYISTDGTTYKYAGSVYGGSRYGSLTANLPAGSDPDTTDILEVDLSICDGNLLSGTQADADNHVTLCLVNNEFISYETATLTGPNQYNLTYLRRGIYNSPIGNHAADDPFVRVDDTIFKMPYQKTQLGQQIYIKFCSFNKYQLNTQSLADVQEYIYTIAESLSYPDNVTGFSALQFGDFVVFSWDNVEDQNLAGYEIRYVPFGQTDWNNGKVVTKVEAGSHLVTANVPIGNWTLFIAAIDDSGNYSVTPASTTINITSTDTIIAGGIDLSTLGWPGTLTNLIKHYTGAITLQSQGTSDADGWNTFDETVPNPYSTGTYVAPEIALGQDEKARVYAVLSAVLGPNEVSGNPVPEIDLEYHVYGGSYSGFAEWTIGYLTASNFTFRFVITAANGIGIINQFIPTLDKK
jgi:Putative phage tail protein